MLHRFLFAFCFALFCGFACGCSAAEHTRDSLETVFANVGAGKAIMVDVREKYEWDDGHLACAHLYPLSELRRGVDPTRLDQKKIIYCYCASGYRVRPAADILTPFGYDVRPLAQGYSVLLRAGFKKAGTR